MAEYTAVEKTYWVAHNPSVHYGVLEPGEHVSTGQLEFEHFARLLPWRARVSELGGNPDDVLVVAPPEDD